MSASAGDEKRKIVLAVDRRYDEVLDLENGLGLTLPEFIGSGDYADIVEKKRVALENAFIDGKQSRYVCQYCKQPMVLRSVPTRDRTEDRFYFRHRFDDGKCTGKKGLSPKAICELKYANTKESRQHIRFKEVIVESIEADPNFIETKKEARWVSIDGVSWRKPDVQSKWKGQRAAFEVQLSTTFLHIIAQRQSFYRNNDGRLLWVFRDLDISHFSQAEDDIFCSNNRNAFQVSDETAAISKENGRFALRCAWYEPIVEGGIVVPSPTPRHKIVFFDELHFDIGKSGAPRSYYFDYDSARDALVARLERETAERRRLSQEALDQPLRDAMEGFVVGFIDNGDSQGDWQTIRKRFKDRAFDLPDDFYWNDGLFSLLQAAYSAKIGEPVASGQSNLKELANTLFNSRKKSLLVFSVMMGHYSRASAFKENKRPNKNRKSWADKVREYQAGWLSGDPQYVPDRRYDDLLAFLFPEAARALHMTPEEVLALRRAGKAREAADSGRVDR